MQLHLMVSENEVLTRALVEVKVLYAEKDAEYMRLAQVGPPLFLSSRDRNKERKGMWSGRC